MKRNRVKAAGLGLALCAGFLRGQDPQPPAMLPSAVRGEPWPAASDPAPAETVWLPAKGHTPPPTVIPAGAGNPPIFVLPDAVKPKPTIPEIPATKVPSLPNVEIPAPKSPFVPSVELPATKSPFVPSVELPATKLPAIPAMEVAAPKAPSIPVIDVPAPKAAPAAELPELPATPAPFPAAPAIPAPTMTLDLPVVQPKVDPLLKPDPLPKPRPTVPPIPRSKDSSDSPLTPKPAEKELPTAPPELMVPGGVPVPGKHGTFGSPGVRISKDYPAMHDLVDHDFSLWGGLGEWWSGWGVSEGSPNLAVDRLELRMEYLLWWVNAQRVPVLATTSTNSGLGFLGEPGTQILQDAGTFGHSPRGGFRARGGYWFDDCGRCGIDGSFFFLANQSSHASFDSSNYPVLTRPIYAPNIPGEFGEIVAYPGISTGRLDIESTSKLWGFDLNVRRALCKTCDSHSEVFAGYRALALNESIGINEFITALPGNENNDPAGTLVTVHDSFQTRNRFNGGQVGYYTERTWERWTLEGRGSVALGNTSQTVEITGFQTRTRPGQPMETFSGGLLATGPNLGKFERDRFSVVPEFSVNVGYWVTPVIKAYVGYNFLYWSNVVRAGDQIDRVVDVTLVPNPPPGVPFSGQYRPQPTFNQANLSVNGIQFGIMGRW
ncbi:MAG: BBP7 family outer membrane beta-barrel protein [Gemmataceae bacterium]